MRKLWALVAMFAFTQIALAQDLGALGGAEKPDGTVVRGEDRIRYICKQLDLTPDQQKAVGGFLAVYHAEIEEGRAPQNMRDRMERIRNLYIELREAKENERAAGAAAQKAQQEAAAAKAANDADKEKKATADEQAAKAKEAAEKARAEKLKADLQNEAPNAAAEREFFASLEPNLTDAQKKKLKDVVARIEADPDVSLKPAAVIAAARELDLSDEQKTKLDDTARDMRARMSGERDSSSAAKAKAVDDLIVAVRALLTPAQQPKFDKKIDALRPVVTEESTGVPLGDAPKADAPKTDTPAPAKAP